MAQYINPISGVAGLNELSGPILQQMLQYQAGNTSLMPQLLQHFGGDQNLFNQYINAYGPGGYYYNPQAISSAYQTYASSNPILSGITPAGAAGGVGGTPGATPASTAPGSAPVTPAGAITASYNVNEPNASVTLSGGGGNSAAAPSTTPSAVPPPSYTPMPNPFANGGFGGTPMTSPSTGLTAPGTAAGGASWNGTTATPYGTTTSAAPTPGPTPPPVTAPTTPIGGGGPAPTPGLRPNQKSLTTPFGIGNTAAYGMFGNRGYSYQNTRLGS